MMVTRNVVANFVGRGWIGLVALVFLPVYFRFLGPEGYGLVGLFVTFQAFSGLLDLGLAATLTRELARLSASPNGADQGRDLLRTLEVVYLAMAAAISLVAWWVAPAIASGWLRVKEADAEPIANAIALMGLALALQWPSALYSGALNGVQRQGLQNALAAGFATLRFGGAVLVLWLVAPTAEAFFIWQAVAGAAYTLLNGRAAWGTIKPSGRPARFDAVALRKLWRFAAGITGISMTAVVLTQADKLILSRMLPLAEFGYYALAATVAGGFYLLAAPFFAALFPRLAELHAAGDEAAVRALYHRACQALAVLILPAAALLVLNGDQILAAWIGDPATAESVYPLLSLLVIGTTCNALYSIPYALQLAYGWTRLALWLNLGAILVLGPVLAWSTGEYGAKGAATVWILVNAIYLIIGIHLMHGRLFPREKLSWYRDDVLPALVATLVVSVPARIWLRPEVPTTVELLGWLVVVAILSVAFAALLTPCSRSRLLAAIHA